jgi:heme exporter protein B
MIIKLLQRDFMMALKSANGLLSTIAILVLSIAIYSFLPQNKAADYDFFVHNILLTLAFIALLTSSTLFFDDLEDGSLEQIIIAGANVEDIFLAKSLLHFCVALMPISIATPLIARIFNIEQDMLIYIMLIVSIGFSFTSAYTGLIIYFLHKNTLIGIIIVLPLMISQLIVAKMTAIAYDHLTMLIGLVAVISVATFLMGCAMLKDILGRP